MTPQYTQLREAAERATPILKEWGKGLKLLSHWPDGRAMQLFVDGRATKAGEWRAVLAYVDRLEQAAADVEEMLRALEPFSKFAEALNEAAPDEIAIGIYADGAMRFGPSGGANVGDLRRARAIVEKHNG